MSKTVLEALFDYFRACPLMRDNRLNIDYLPADTEAAGVEFAISTTPTDEVITRYKDGGARCRYPFTISSVNDYGPDEVQNMLNSGFYDALATWLNKQSRARHLPELPEGYTARTIAAKGPGYLYQPDVNAGKYQIQCELEYYKKGEK